jgi:hypothetical protein
MKLTLLKFPKSRTRGKRSRKKAYIAKFPGGTIKQLDLANILNLEGQIAGLQKELTERMETIGADLRRGAEIEEGPIRAWFTKLEIH